MLWWKSCGKGSRSASAGGAPTSMRTAIALSMCRIGSPYDRSATRATLESSESRAERGVDQDGKEQGCCWAWTEESGYSFAIPPGLVEAVYGSERWPLGS